MEVRIHAVPAPSISKGTWCGRSSAGAVAAAVVLAAALAVRVKMELYKMVCLAVLAAGVLLPIRMEHLLGALAHLGKVMQVALERAV